MIISLICSMKRMRFSVEENSMYREMIQRERDLQEKLKSFMENTIERWMRSFENEDFLHLNEPLLRKEKKYYVVNIKPEVRRRRFSSIRSRSIICSFSLLSMKFHVSIKYPTFLSLLPSKNSTSTSIDFKIIYSISVLSIQSTNPTIFLPFFSEYITKSYRHIFDHILIIEQPIIQDELTSIENNLDKASSVISLNIDRGTQFESEILRIINLDSTDFLRHLRRSIHDFEERLFQSKSNLEQIQKILKRFLKTPLYSRGETRQDPLLMVYDKEDRIFKRNNELYEIGIRFQDILKVRFSQSVD